ncbi:class I SAM-dependent methyltransferase [Actinocorallia sp. A-T 12471]|uniref:class I SAM-dependent methyltransferase n=1 Tax=Actinocorallia sp. A-T 12471 TaxID=3089813 RepID=UPI0029CD8CE5|nr:class I SAM-dependent methyltransferase [Actinocorallia sp. A-T 12471]MDX6743803.1 class I SAM-dependent methyltransferase [Actinocorallia sp. A-T 12471]
MDLRHQPPPDRGRRPPSRLIPDRFEWTRAPGIGPPLSVLGDLTGRRVLELGCGSGHNLAHLAYQHGALAVGVDHDPAKIDRARETYREIPGLSFVQSDATAFLGSQPSGSYDLVLSIFGAFSFTDPLPLTAHSARVLRPGGRLALTLRTTDRTDQVVILLRR